MTEEKKTVAEEATEAEEAAKTAEAPTAEAEAETAAPKEEKAEKKKSDKKLKAELTEAKEALEKLTATLEEERKNHLYMMAEYENYRRRSQKEKDGVYTEAVADVIGDILPVLDNLDRAALCEAEKIAEGLALTAKSAKSLLGKYGVEAYGEKGDAFDPNIHNAVMHEENEELGENVISEVFQIGYRKGDKIIRFAMVKVAN
jgi:molecular chaperone GrpE